MMKKYLVFLILILIILAAAWGPIVSNVEQAKYTVVESDGAIEIRDYAPMIIAEVEVSGDRTNAIRNGFRIIADYIFGNNIASQKVAMTAPVSQQMSEKIAMTAPVAQQGTASGQWKVHFVMPSAYKIDTLPKPRNKAVKLKEISGKRFAVIRFSGLASQEKLDKEQKNLERFITQHALTPIGQPTYAFYNPPWTLPFFRRNEVMIEIQKPNA